MAKGITTARALSYSTRDINRMSTEQLRATVSVTRSTARKRYERMVEADIYSPAKDYLQKSAKGDSILPSVKDLDRVELINEYKRQKHFLELKTSTVKGAKQAQKEIKTATEEVTKRELTDGEVTLVWQTVDKLRDSELGGVLDYRKAAEETANVLRKKPNISEGDLFDDVKQRMIDIYEAEESARSIYPSRKFNT